MSERQTEISFVMDMIQKLCEEAKIGLVPYRSKDGQLMVVIEDAIDGSRYVMLKSQEV